MRARPRLAAGVAAAALLVALAPAGVGLGASGDDEGEAGVSVAVFLLADGELSRHAHATLMRGMERALKQNRRLAVKDKDLLLAEFAGEVPSEDVGEARALYAAGRELLDKERAREAIDKLVAAEAAFEKVLAFARKNELADTQFLLGVAYAAASEKRKARAAFQRLQVWRAGYAFDAERYPQIVPLWEDARKDIARGGRGSLEIMSEPEGALAFVDGKYVGVTPTAADGLPEGDHYVTLKLEGYQRRVVKARVDARYQELVTETLPRSEKYLLVEQSLTRARASLGAERADVAMLDLRTFLFIDQAVFLKVTPKGNVLRVDAYLYDLRSKRRLSQVLAASVDSRDVDAANDALSDVATSLYTGVRYDGRDPEAERLARERKKPRKKGPTPIYARWWFWTAIGVGVAAVATPILFYDDLVGPPPPSCPDGHTCVEVLINY